MTFNPTHMTLNELSKANLERCEAEFHPLTEWSELEWLGCVEGELGEIAKLLKKEKRGDFTTSPEVDAMRQRLCSAFGGAVVYLDLLAQRCRIDLGEVTQEEFNRKSEALGSPLRV